ncbi:hypothetical protein [Dietzia sp. NCCP-2495]|uniref:hypothetical protein n=1 Tax=Dietzia sp. NCCP-2495 TaxID=2934675 RepID=UPI0022315F66|nr:hypothetical protein [Dietzia sp. NCCP-2495]
MVTTTAIAAGTVPHVLVLTRRIPFTSLAGGRVADEHRAQTASAASIPLLAAEACLALWAGRHPTHARQVGTDFERRYAAPLCALWLAGAAGLAAGY